MFLNVAARRSLQRRPRYHLFESKFDSDTNFETPVAIFVFQVERYVVTTRAAVIRAIEQAEAIDNTFVDCTLKYVMRLISNRHSLCRRKRCAVFVRND
jgi:hypothetical protein